MYNVTTYTASIVTYMIVSVQSFFRMGPVGLVINTLTFHLSGSLIGWGEPIGLVINTLTFHLSGSLIGWGEPIGLVINTLTFHLSGSLIGWGEPIGLVINTLTFHLSGSLIGWGGAWWHEKVCGGILADGLQFFLYWLTHSGFLQSLSSAYTKHQLHNNYNSNLQQTFITARISICSRFLNDRQLCQLSFFELIILAKGNQKQNVYLNCSIYIICINLVRIMLDLR